MSAEPPPLAVMSMTNGIGRGLLQRVQEDDHVVVRRVFDRGHRAGAGIIVLPGLFISFVERIEHADGRVPFLDVGHALAVDFRAQRLDGLSVRHHRLHGRDRAHDQGQDILVRHQACLVFLE